MGSLNVVLLSQISKMFLYPRIVLWLAHLLVYRVI